MVAYLTTLHTVEFSLNASPTLPNAVSLIRLKPAFTCVSEEFLYARGDYRHAGRESNT
jgi:hypothetical protein